MASAACALPASKSIAVGRDGRAYMMHAGHVLALKAAGDPNLEPDELSSERASA